MTVTASNVDITAVKARHSLAAVVESAGVKLHGIGRVRQGVCPFHDEAEGSFTVYSDSQRWYCFGCGEGGDVLDFIQRTESVPLSAALQLLGGGAATALPRAPLEHVPAVSELPARESRAVGGSVAILHRAAATECRCPRVPEWARDRGCHRNGARPRLRAGCGAPRVASRRRIRR